MGNFLTDNEDLVYYMERGVDWEALAGVVEQKFPDPDGFETRTQAAEFYAEVLELLGRFSADEIAPYSQEIDDEGVKLIDGRVVLPERVEEIFRKLTELGAQGLCVPREVGGLNCPLLSYMLSAEIMARADAAVMTHYAFHAGIAMALLVYSVMEGSTEFDPADGRIVSTRFSDAIEEIMAGDAWGSMDITEPNAGSDMAALRTHAVLDEEGVWRLSGEKVFISSGHGKFHVVIARTEEATNTEDPFAGLKGLSLFLVRAFETGADGERVEHATVTRIEEKMGLHGSATCSMNYDESPADLIGKRGEGFRLMLMLMNNARLGVAFESLGVCEAAWRLAADYAAERRSMGKTIDQHELVADMLDEMKTDIQGIRALSVKACYHEEMARRAEIMMAAKDQVAADVDLARNKRRHMRISRELTPLAKYLASEKAVEIARRGVQIHGGMGYIREVGAEKLLRDALVFPIYEGTSQIQALMAMKDALIDIMRRPRRFLGRQTRHRWRSMSARDPLERRTARLELMVLSVQQALLLKTASGKLRGVTQLPMVDWIEGLRDGWDPKRDFSYAMLHAERLTQMMADAAIATALWEQVEKHDERREVLERHLERAEPRCRFLRDAIATTGARLVESLAAESPDALDAVGS